MATPPSSIITQAMTFERTGLSMKNFDNIRRGTAWLLRSDAGSGVCRDRIGLHRGLHGLTDPDIGYAVHDHAIPPAGGPRDGADRPGLSGPLLHCAARTTLFAFTT